MSARSFFPEIERIIASSDRPEESREILTELAEYSSSFVPEMNMLLTTGTPNAMRLAAMDLLQELELLTGVGPFLIATGKGIEYKKHLIETHVWAKWTVGKFLDDNDLSHLANNENLVSETHSFLIDAHSSIAGTSDAPAGSQREPYWRGLNIARIASETIYDGTAVTPASIKRLSEWCATRDDALMIREVVCDRQTLDPTHLEAILGESSKLAPAVRNGAL